MYHKVRFIMKIPYRDLRVKDPVLKSELLESIDKVLSHGRILMGPELIRFEEEVAHYCGRRYCIGVNSGTDALYLALRALDIGPGDEVITTSLSWIATTNAIVLTGAKPVFIDIDEDLNINADLIEVAITKQTKAIVPVHFTGQMCDMICIKQIADKYNLTIIEDGAQAFGASRDEIRCGSSGVMSCFSMNPMKIYNAYGEAGAILTDDEAIRDHLNALRYNGTINRQDCHYPSLNGRLDTIQAAMLLVSLKYFEEKINKRRIIATAYRKSLEEIVTCPVEHSGSRHTYYAYSILAKNRDDLIQFLTDKGIETQIQHTIPMPYHTAYKGRFAVEIPMCESVTKHLLCLPNQEDLSLEEVEYVCQCIREFYKG
jgi:dTDP-4-amino-4,6-dideoxygalactose transaminase